MLSRSRASLENAIKRAIAATGISVNAVALKSGVSQPILQRFLAGKRGITLHTADRLCAYLKLELTTIGGERRTIEEEGRS